jgi:hypothetical protein
VALREEHKLKTFENRVLRRIFGFGLAYHEYGEDECI